MYVPWLNLFKCPTLTHNLAAKWSYLYFGNGQAGIPHNMLDLSGTIDSGNVSVVHAWTVLDNYHAHYELEVRHRA